MKNKKEKSVALLLIMLIFLGLSIFFEPFYALDRIIMDKWYQRPVTTNNKIKIIAIDEKTLKDFGTFGTWSRQVYADLIDKICLEGSPSVIGFDITFKSPIDASGDNAFASVANNHSVVVANMIVFDKNVTKNDLDILEVDSLYVDQVEETYLPLQNSTLQGFSNAILDKDGKVRKSLYKIDYDGQTIYSFAALVANTYLQSINETLVDPPLDHNGSFGIKFSGNTGDYDVISFTDVMHDKIDSRIFNDCIVLIGAYASGMQDAYATPIELDQSMFGVEIQANIIEALINQTTYQEVNFFINLIYSYLVFILVALCLVKLSFIKAAIVSLVSIGLHLLFGKFLFNIGYELPLINVIIAISISYLIYVAYSYFTQRYKAKQIESVLRKYIAPQIVDEVMKSGNYELEMAGITKDIAVLFVDIRGFTTLSEQVEPSVVVEILNKYLSFTTETIFKYHGTLDKFIGDATMAVFNSPLDLDDYEYRALQTAYAIAKGSNAINDFTMEKYGIQIGFGVGVNCGKAVVGNIGSNVRMDYTAIGDTVNTASRLEGQAKAGQVVVSKEMMQRLKNRAQFKLLGEVSLKGKHDKMEIYELVSLDSESN